MTNNTDPDFEKMLAAALGKTEHDQIERATDSDIPEEDVPPGHKSGYVAVVGRPNVGKSTLINQILGEKVAIVSPKPQTTRIRQLGILTRDDAQIIFIDTPGVHKAKDEMGEFMVEIAKAALEDADVILFVVDITEAPGALDRQVADYVQTVSEPEKVIQVINKIDAQKNPEKFQQHFEAYRQLAPQSEMVSTVARAGHNVPDLIEKILARLPEGPRYFPKDQISDLSVRLIVAEMIREQVLQHTEQEVPHSIAVEVNEFKQRNARLIYIGATIYCERDGQKKIIIGKNGNMLKTISSAARQEIETFVDSKVFLEVWVKVLENWRESEKALRRFGYRIEK